jgi:hypothetical protein
MLLAAAIEKANCRRVISILTNSSAYKSWCLSAQFPEGKTLVLLVRNSATVGVGVMNGEARLP